jgi:hypothetical protein
VSGSRCQIKRIPGTERVFVEGEIAWSKNKHRDLGVDTKPRGRNARRNESGASVPAKEQREYER